MQMPKAQQIEGIYLTKNKLCTPIYSSQIYGWKNILVEEFCQPWGDEKYQNLAEHTLCLSLNRHPPHLSQVMNNCHHASYFAKGDISVAPAQSLLCCRWSDQDHYARIRISSQFLQQVAQESIDNESDHVELKPEFRVRNSQIESISLMLLGELKNEGLAGQLYVESLTNLLAVHLLRQHTTTHLSINLYNSRLSDRQLRQIADYIDEHLDQEIKLLDLAQLVGLSPFYFSRLFKQSIGIPPHQYVLQQRVERAKQLLKTTKLPITEIAISCGFSSHSHLGKLIRQCTGLSPKAYRIS